MSAPRKPATLVVALGGLALSGAAFAMQPLPQGYLLAAQAAASPQAQAEGSAEADHLKAGKEGFDRLDTDQDGRLSRAEFDAAHPDKAAAFDRLDANKDGYIDAAEYHSRRDAAPAGGEASADAAAMKMDAEGKCGGEGGCGGSL